MSYLGTAINESPVIAGKAGASIENGAFLAVKYDSSGNVVLAGAGDNAIGILPAETPEKLAANDTVTVQVKDIGRWKAGAAFDAGTEVTSDANGKAVAATSGKFITAIALETASAADQIVRVQVCKAGYKA